MVGGGLGVGEWDAYPGDFLFISLLTGLIN